MEPVDVKIDTNFDYGVQGNGLDPKFKIVDRIRILHCVKSVQIQSFFWSVFSCNRTEYGDLQVSALSPNTGKKSPV